MTDIENNGFWKTREAMAAFGLFCACAEGRRADLSLTDAARCLDFTAEELRAGLVQLAARGILTVAENIKAPAFSSPRRRVPILRKSHTAPRIIFLPFTQS